ncbi:MAG: secondary thiamine-phosphate synthase enzyme YjbQ [Actinomycetota bacterium]|nr:secondary thiamine-phosphate synthase enzyme YjbQ [Actinomycetota bacterium]
MRRDTFSIDTTGAVAVDITDRVSAFARDRGGDGLVNVFVPHATAGVALMETGASSEADLEEALDRLLPRDHRYRHAHGSPGHGADHLLPVLVGPSTVIPVEGGRLLLGTWQRVVVVDPNRDNNRRTVVLSLTDG